MLSKETILQILKLSELENIPEKYACEKITGVCRSINAEKKLYNIPTYKPGESSFCKKIREYSVNDNYFSELTNENCYYAGFIAADGNIDSNYSNKLTITLARKDRDFLNTFLNILDSNYTIHDGTQKDKYEYSAIYITSNQICNDLKVNFNIIPNKFLVYCPPKFKNQEFEDCFVMGIIDGDGTIGISSRKNIQDAFYISCVGTKDTILLVKNVFERIVGKSVSNLFQRDKNKNFYSIRISDKNARTVFIYLYEKYSKELPHLKRKWSEEYYNYCKKFKKKLPVSRRKGVNVFDLNGNLLFHCSTLKEAEEKTGVLYSQISKLCGQDDSHHYAKNYMFSRNDFMEPYSPLKCTAKLPDNYNKGIANIEDNA